jgi:glycosyltransferase involved in cell wall biosynthesis
VSATHDRYDVLIPLVTMNASGGVRMALGVANTLAMRGRSVAVSVPADAGPAPISLDETIDVHRRRAHGRLVARFELAGALPAALVTVATGYRTPLLIAAGHPARARRDRLVYLIQNDEPTSHITYGSQPAWSKPVLRWMARAGYRVPATRIAVSRFVADRVGATRIHRVIPAGIDPAFVDAGSSRRDVARRDARVIVGVLAHPAGVKGLRIATDAFASFADDGRVGFVVFDGTNPATVPPFVEPFSRVAPGAGLRHDLVDFYSFCDMFVFPSLVEGFGLPPLEAMACGAAVVVTDCGGVNEYARNRENCLVVRPRHADDIARAVRSLLDDDALRHRIVAGGLATAPRYPAKRFAEECADEIERLL